MDVYDVDGIFRRYRRDIGRNRKEEESVVIFRTILFYQRQFRSYAGLDSDEKKDRFVRNSVSTILDDLGKYSSRFAGMRLLDGSIAYRTGGWFQVKESQAE